MDLVQLSELISKSPYSLPTFLIIVVWWAADAIKRKDNDIKEMHRKIMELYGQDGAKHEKRENFFFALIDWFQWFIESKQFPDNPRSIKKVEPILKEGRQHFESDNQEIEIPPDSVDNGGPITRFRSKLSKRRKSV